MIAMIEMVNGEMGRVDDVQIITTESTSSTRSFLHVRTCQATAVSAVGVKFFSSSIPSHREL